MSLGDTPQAPVASNPVQVSAQQGELNQNASVQNQLNNTGAAVASQQGSLQNYYDPYGSRTYSQTGVGAGGVPIYSTSLNLAPEQQALLDQLNVNKAGMGSAAGGFLGAATNNYGGADQSFANANNSFADASKMFASATPNFDRAVDSFGNATTNYNRGTNAFNTGMGTYDKGAKWIDDYINKDAFGTIGDMSGGWTKQMMDKELGFLQPFQQTERDQLDTKLRNQGLFPGQPGYDNALRQMDTTHSLAVQDFLAKTMPQNQQMAQSIFKMPLDAIDRYANYGAGYGNMGQGYGSLAMGQGQLGSQYANVGAQEGQLGAQQGNMAAQQSNMGSQQGQLGNAQATLAPAYAAAGAPQITSPPPAVPLNIQGSSTSPANYQGAVNSANTQAQQQYQAELAQQQAMMSGLFGVGAAGLGGYASSPAGGAAIAGLMASDRAVKTDIQRVGTLDNGLPVYSFRFKTGGPVQIGLMADEVEQIHPEAVTEINGVKFVHYAKAVEMQS